MRGTTVICWIRDFGFFSQLEVKIFTHISLFCHFFYSACQRNTKILPPEDEE